MTKRRDGGRGLRRRCAPVLALVVRTTDAPARPPPDPEPSPSGPYEDAHAVPPDAPEQLVRPATLGGAHAPAVAATDLDAVAPAPGAPDDDRPVRGASAPHHPSLCAPLAPLGATDPRRVAHPSPEPRAVVVQAPPEIPRQRRAGDVVARRRGAPQALVAPRQHKVARGAARLARAEQRDERERLLDRRRRAGDAAQGERLLYQFEWARVGAEPQCAAEGAPRTGADDDDGRAERRRAAATLDDIRRAG